MMKGIRAHLAFELALVLALAGTVPLIACGDSGVPGSSSSPQDASAEPYPTCPKSGLLDQSGGDPGGTPGTISDDFSVERGQWWCNVTPTTKQTATWFTVTGPDGLLLGIPKTPLAPLPCPVPVGSECHRNSEIITRSQVQPGMAMSARIKGQNVAGVFGSRGWGFWNRDQFDVLGKTAIAWFMYQDGNLCPGNCPKGFYVQTMALGTNQASVIQLPESLLNGTHTYTVILNSTEVEYLVDGGLVAKVTDLTYIPTSSMYGQVWVDNQFYGQVADLQFLSLTQTNNDPTTIGVEWYWQGPADQVPTGPSLP
jgi:hypothetical protein